MHLHTNPYRIFLLPTMCGSGLSSNRGTSTARISTRSSSFTQSHGSQDTPPSVLSRIFSSLSFTLEVPAAVADLQELWRSWGGRTESSATELQSYVAFALLIFIEEDDGQLVNQADKIQKENSTSVASNAHGEPKPTNLKPFRFRTDERGMFKEATSEKKVHAPLKEIALVRTPGAKSTSKHQNVIHVYLGAASALCVV
ncbi:hypothetical protein D8674_010056 [Pyrus ussuriensis x Pyrus communis]|uniref:Uncharacterized protein n=1 Tax=Pyrus ussuriensis x Pyrus communis TaxID=2448454 RepID=A0A5N5F9Q8_9ROSA|nr:hypothetical protein D8674_010056 [Pyrus ussuriensis x Pyrus communis]